MATNNATLAQFMPKDVEYPTGGQVSLDKRGGLAVLKFQGHATGQGSPSYALFDGVLPRGANAGYTATTGVKVIVGWSAAAPGDTGNVVWGASFQLDGQTDTPVPVTENFPAVNSANEVQATAAVNAVVASGIVYTTINVPLAKIQNGQVTAPAAGDHYRLRLRRCVDQAADTVNGFAYIHSVELQDY